MNGIVFDKQRVLQAPMFLKLVRPKEDENLIFVVTDNASLQALNQSRDKLQFLNTEFLSNIKYAVCGKFEKRIITLEKCDSSYLTVLLRTVQQYFEKDVKIICPAKDSLISEGFSNPQICTWDSQEVCLEKPNVFLSSHEKETLKHKMDYQHSQREPFCYITLTIDHDSVDFLENICHAGVTVNGDGDRSQKEVFGRFQVVKTLRQGNDIIHTLKVDKESVVYGSEDNIQTTGSLYTFHSHPLNAYLLYNVQYGVPSATDYWSVYNMCKRMAAIIHFVASIEGLYTISCLPNSKIFVDWSSRQVKEFIWKHLKIRSRNQVTNLKSYIHMVNKLGLFKLGFLPWAQIKHKNIQVQFKRKNKTCRIDDN